MTNVTFIQGLKEIGGTFVRVETDGAICLFDFGFAVASRIDPAVCLRPESLAADYARLGMLPAEPGIYEPAPQRRLALRPGAGLKNRSSFSSRICILTTWAAWICSPPMCRST